MNQTIAYTNKVRYFDSSQGAPPREAKLITLWGGLPTNLQREVKPTHEMDLCITIRVDELGEPVDIFKHDTDSGQKAYVLLCRLLPGEVRTFNLSLIETLAGAVTQVANADSLVHCILHQSLFKLSQ